jgi:hypothetical protein
MTELHAAKDTHAKALAINLQASIYGSFAEIGAGQEVARWFLTVGAASGTVAQTISAYDKAVSDDTYGAGTRYVSRERLLAMLDHEYKLVTERLGPTRSDRTCFFAFADTVATRNFKGDNEQHGWVGLRFQIQPRGDPSDVLLHINLMDPTAQQQQEALGVLGVNLLYGAHHARGSADEFLACLSDTLSIDRLEIDVLELSGPAFAGQDPRAWCLELLRKKMAQAIVFDSSFHVVEPSSVLRKRPLIIDRGRFDTLERFHADMLRAGDRALRAERIDLHREPLGIVEIALHPVLDDDAPDNRTFLARVESALGLAPALVTDLPEAYQLAPYLRRYTTEPLRLVGGVAMLAYILQSQFYDALVGSLLEGLGKLFASNVKFYAYPMPRAAVTEALGSGPSRVHIADSKSAVIGADDLILEPPLLHLYRYLREAGWVVPIEVAPG